METITAPAQHGSRAKADLAANATATALQAVLTDLVALGVLAKHAHWNVTGPGFASLHELLDDIAAVAGAASDQIAERIRAVHCYPDGRATWGVVGHTPFDLPAGRLQDAEVIEAFGAILWTVGDRLRRSIAATSDDSVSQDVLIGVAHDIDKRAWLVGAHQ